MATKPVGAGSSILDVESIVASLMQIERRRVTSIETQIKRKDTEISAVASLKSKASALEAALKKLETPSAISARTTASSDATIVKAGATTSAAVGAVEVKVVSSAQATRVVAGGFSSDTALVGEGTLTLEVGAYATSNGTTSFMSSASESISIPAGSTLSDLKDLINGADAGMTASIVRTSDTYSLVVTAKETGLDNAIRLVASGAQNLPGNGEPDFTSIAYSAATGESSSATLLQSARNAVVYLDGLRVERDSNTIDNAVEGLTFTLQKSIDLNDVSEATPVTIAVSETEGQLKGALNEVAAAYNDFYKTYTFLSASSLNAANRGVLNADAGMRSLASRVRDAFSNGMTYSVSDGNGGTTTETLPFWRLGLELQRDGTVALNETKLAAAISDGAADMLKEGVSVSAQGVLEDAISFTGDLELRTQTAKDLQRTLDKRRLELEDRLEVIERGYRQRYAALDATLSRLNGVNNSVQQVLDQLKAQYND